MAKASPIPRSSLPLPKARLTAANLLSTTVVLEEYQASRTAIEDLSDPVTSHISDRSAPLSKSGAIAFFQIASGVAFWYSRFCIVSVSHKSLERPMPEKNGE
jgi:hypothetical protein